MAKHNYIVGIDLGTTNCTVAYAQMPASVPAAPQGVPDSLKNNSSMPLESLVIEQLSIPQITGSGTEEELFLLPSFVYFPLPEEYAQSSASMAWDPLKKLCTGLFARQRGAELPNRLISSAKSWLCHAGIDRREKLLPLQAEDIEKLSPLEACAEFLRHILKAWNFKLPDAPFDQQHIFITVPASFDPSARQLVQEAAQLAGYPEIILLEEPQAAFYAWLHMHAADWRSQLVVGDTILIVDIGGGTTDFSLITVSEELGNLALNRLAVGNHLLLGGDNIDLALAYQAKAALEEQGHSIDEWQMHKLIHASRQAKESLLGDAPPKSVDINLQGRGSKLLKGALSTKITQKQATELLLDGFFPLVGASERSPSERRSGMQQIGLPYAQDARISCQLAKFLSMSGENDHSHMHDFVLPTAVLFNGGTLKAAALRQRLVELLNAWAVELKKAPVRVLPEPNYDFAVSRGAVYYGLARSGQAIRIRGGTSRSYYIGVEEARPAIPGFATPLKALCIVPFGMEEGTEQELASQEFALVLGEPAIFRFFSHATPKLADGTEASMGYVIKNWKQDLTELHPIETCLEKTESDGKTIRVRLKSKVTELGTLELWCVAHDGRKWKLEFDVRKK